MPPIPSSASVSRRVRPAARRAKPSRKPRSALVVTVGSGASRSNLAKSISVMDDISARTNSMNWGSESQRRFLANASSVVSATIGAIRKSTLHSSGLRPRAAIFARMSSR